MATLPKDRAAHFRTLATDARAIAANMADYGARHTMMQAASMWDQVAEREQERCSNRLTHRGPPKVQVRVLSTAGRRSLGPREIWIAFRSLATKLLHPQPYR
jgi:hypothetical protein